MFYVGAAVCLIPPTPNPQPQPQLQPQPQPPTPTPTATSTPTPITKAIYVYALVPKAAKALNSLSQGKRSLDFCRLRFCLRQWHKNARENAP
jgi:hypothetical protein